MKVLLYTILIFVCMSLFIACKSTTLYVPIETIRTEYKDKLVRDSIYLQDSIFVFHKGDTVFYNKYKYLYRDKLVRDSIYITDSIQVPYPVVEYKEVNKLTSFQTVCIWFGEILMGLLSIGLIILFLKWKRLF